jgi:alanyl-tRNA synthetase
MFVNAGMVPFKNVFTGLESRETPRAASSQKCVRAGGKHNDLDNVGYTARHHTFFEMLGNFSFGDYFKEQAITHAWTLLTKEWGLDPARLTTTVYHTDDEAFDLWRKIAGLPEERIIRIATTDNFWSMGDTGPCGPCSEIFYDHGDHIFGGPPGSPDEDGDRFVEIWNLVFMQFERQDDGTDLPLPKPSIDTGMGLERIAAVMQGVPDNYDTDTFKALINASEELTGTKAVGDQKASHRVIADHLRSTSFLLADGVMPSNEGRGYVLRRIMRRAMRHAHILGAKEPLMHRLVGSLAAEMGAAYPELLRAQPMIEATLKQEETQFRRTLDKGIKLLDGEMSSIDRRIKDYNDVYNDGFGMPDAIKFLQGAPKKELSGLVAFKLYDTYGFPFDLTEDALRAKGYTIDRDGFDAAMREQKSRARAAWKGSGAKSSDDVWFDIAERFGSTEFTGYTATYGQGQVVAIVDERGLLVDWATKGDKVDVITNQTPFYGESGGQMGDTGEIHGSKGAHLVIEDTSKPLGKLHAMRGMLVGGELRVGDVVSLEVNEANRNALRANHSATHLLHASLRHRLGEHVSQKGSMVAPDRLRFDFSHNQAVTPQEIAMIEADVNAQIRGNDAVTTRLMTPDDAVAAGALALFGEKYGDEVRVLTMGKSEDAHYSLELCGGTHVNALGDIALFTIVSEGAVASGIRRIEALTGEAARLWLVGRETQLKNVAAMLKTAPDEVSVRIETLINERKRMEKELSEAKTALALSGGGGPKAEAEHIGDIAFMGQVIAGIEPKMLRGLADDQMKAIGSGIVAIIAANENSNTVVVAVSPALHGTVTAPDLVRVATEAMGAQGGGGRPDMAQGGGPAGAELAQAALAAIKAAIAV